MKNPFAQRFMLASRMRGGLHVHDRRGGIRGITRALDAGCIVLQVADQHQRLRGLVAPFFGELASTERAAATLAVRKRCPFVVAAGIRTGTGFRFKFVIEEIIEPELTGDVQRDIQRLVERMNDALGRLILRFPEQYLWIHNRYRDSVRESSQTAP
jgi:KDO2-lipid IV(A) lauroyltransferase